MVSDQSNIPFITVVSGFPRSGTSMMMQMLQAGGMPLLTDSQRTADEDNPRGYLELEAVKNTRQDASWITRAPGHAVKVIHFLLPSLPPAAQPYRVVMMRRPLAEVLRSQATMLERSGKTPPPPAGIGQVFTQQMQAAEAAITSRTDMSVCEVDYAQSITDPVQAARAVARFLPEADLDVSAMAGCIDPRLYRQRM